mgnify:CR=1 FL=1
MSSMSSLMAVTEMTIHSGRRVVKRPVGERPGMSCVKSPPPNGDDEDDGDGWSHKDRNGWVGKMEEKDKPGRN